MIPSREDFQVFVRTFEVLTNFEATQFVIRGYGAFDRKDLPIPEVRRVLDWLKEQGE